MALALAVGSVVTTILLLVLIQKLKRNKRHAERWSYHFLVYTIELFVPLTIVAIFYAVLLSGVSNSPDTQTVAALVALEQRIEYLNSIVSRLKLSPTQVLAALALLFCLGLLRISRAKSKQFSGGLKQYQRWIGRVYLLVYLAGCFTLFGSQLGDPLGELRLRMKTIRDGYADVLDDTKDLLTRETQQQLYKKSTDALPPSYAAALALPKEIDKDLSELRTAYSNAQSDYKVKIPLVERVLATSSSPVGSNVSDKAEAPLTTDQRPVRERLPRPESLRGPHSAAEVPHAATVERVQNARRALRELLLKKPATIALMEAEGGRQVIAQLPKSFTDAAKARVFQSLIERYPIVGPVVNVFVNTLDKKIEMRIENSLARLARLVLERPETVSQTIASETDAVVSSASVSVEPSTLADAQRQVAALESRAKQISDARAECDRQVLLSTRRAADVAVVELSHRTESVRENAVRKLGNVGNKLSDAQVKRVVRIMKHGSQRWSRNVGREGHCTFYEYTSVRRYAAQALLAMSNPSISTDIEAEARRTVDSGRKVVRVTDPGWI